MRSKLLCLCLVLLAAGAALLHGQGGKNQIPATAVFRDASGDRIRSDRAGPYVDGSSDCVRAQYDAKSGSFFLRTVSPDSICAASIRKITIDLSSWVSGTVDCNRQVTDRHGNLLAICGVNDVPDVRILADKLFHDSALSNGTRVSLPFSLVRDFQATGFTLEFEQALPVTLTPDPNDDPDARSVTAGGVAELYEIQTTKKGFNKVSLGRYYMPFQLTVERLP